MALVTIERTQAQFPLGARGQRPVKFHVGPYVAKEMLDARLPGVRVFSSDGVVACSWDYASSVATLLGLEKELPAIPLEAAIPLPGIEEYKAKLKAGNRPHQPEAIRFLARRAWAYLADDMRSGKSRTAIAAATAIGAKRVLVLTPNIAKFVWPREIYKWLGEQSLILEGRSGREARTWCVDCRGRGTRAIAAFEEAVCATCKGVGDLPAHVRETAGPDPIELDEEEDGAWCSLWPALHRGCREHRHIRMHPVDGRWCQPCHEKLRSLMTTTRWTIANFDILVQQHERQGGGVVARRTDLAGWGGAGGPLRFARYDLVIIDEMHNLRGYDNKSYTQTRRARTERVYDAIFDIPRVWGLSGTPTFGFTADLWPQLNILSKGLFGEKPWDFDVRFCLPGEAPIWMDDMTFRRIDEVKKGDTVIGWTQGVGLGSKSRLTKAEVLEVFEKEDEVVEVVFESGKTLRCTLDHAWANVNANTKQYSPWTAVHLGIPAERDDGTGQFKSKARGPAQIGYLVDVCQTHTTDGPDYAAGYLHGAIDGDGTFKYGWFRRPNKERVSFEFCRSFNIRVLSEEFITRCREAAVLLGVEHSSSPRLNSKQLFNLTLTGESGAKLMLAPRDGNDDYWRGYLAGIYDAEGWGAVIAQCRTVNPHTYDNIVDGLKRFSFDAHCSDEAITIRGGRSALVRFWNLVRPAIVEKRDGVNVTSDRERLNGFKSPFFHREDVVSIESVGRMKVHCLKTTTENFVAYGFGSHNCAGFRDVYGWNNEGRSPLADTELRDRLATVMIRRLTHEINPDQPGMDHQIVELEVPDKDLKSRDWGQSGRKAIETEVRRLSRLKWPAVAEAVCDEMINGRRTYVLTYHVREAADLAKFIAEEMESRQRVRRLREVHAKLWLCHGELVAKDDKYRDRIAQEFVEHTGAGVFIATYDSMQGAISLLGANSIHEVDWHHSPAAQAQAERRVAEFEVRHLIPVLHYTIKKSIDVKLERQVLPKLETMSAIVRDRDAKNLMGSLLARREASADIGDQSLDFYAQLASDAVTLDLEGLDYKFDTHYEGDT